MTNLQDLINLAKADGGKFFVIDEQGEAKLVIMSVEDYQRLLLNKLQKQVQRQAEDVEKINKEILKAQLQEQEPVIPVVPAPKIITPRVTERIDLRSEVIDPSFDFEGPKTELDDL